MKIAILGTGAMANVHAEAFSQVAGVEVVTAIDVRPQAASDFAKRHAIPRSFTSLDEALRWGEFDAVANVTPDAIHYPTTIKLLENGKHVFCEKPLAENYQQAKEMADLAEKTKCIAMVNLSYRHVAPIHAARQLVTDGRIGQPRHFEASYLQSWLVSKIWGDWRTELQWLWRLSRGHGSNGVLGDVGIHIVDFVSFGIAGNVERLFSRLKTFHKNPNDQIGDYKLDANDSFAMTAEMDNGALGVIHASRFATGHLNELRLKLHGDKGAFEVVATPEESHLRVCLDNDVEKGQWREIDVAPVATNYEKFAHAVMHHGPSDPGFSYAAELQKVLDRAIDADRERKERAI